jgi:GntR family transcriptional regulator
VGTFITRSLGQASLAEHGPLQQELRTWLAKARAAGLTEPGIDAMIQNTLRESAEEET